jgi:DNA-binding GntR family transcriptional regulator
MSTTNRRLPVVRSVAMRDGIVQAIRQALLEGRFKPGESLSDVAIAKEMNVSRSPVREALLVLAQQGLITHSQNYGFSVLGFTDTDHREIDQIRLKLEALALTLARVRLTGEDLNAVQALNERMASLSREGHLTDWVRAEVEFHGLLWELSGNRWLVSCLKQVMIPYFNYETAFRLQPQVTDLPFLDQHQIYVDFLRGATSYTAEECVRYHLEMSEGIPGGVGTGSST